MLGSISQEPWRNDTSIHFGHFGVGCFLLDQQVRRQRFDSGCQKGDFNDITVDGGTVDSSVTQCSRSGV